LDPFRGWQSHPDKFGEFQNKDLLTVLVRAGGGKQGYDRDRECDIGYCPKDRALDIEGTSESWGKRRRMRRVGVPRSFELGPEDLSKLAGIRVSAKEVERVSGMGAGRKKSFRQARQRRPRRDRMVLVKSRPRMPGGTDGPGVPVGKKETDGRRGKEEDGQAKAREIKLGCMFTPTGWMRKIV
jgi:hypothetical protein